MACPTCDHTMQNLALGWFWCPRCGTVRERYQEEGFPRIENDSVPKLVERLRDPNRNWKDVDESIGVSLRKRGESCEGCGGTIISRLCTCGTPHPYWDQ